MVMNPRSMPRCLLAVCLVGVGSCAPDEGELAAGSSAVVVVASCPEAVRPDDRGDPRNAADRIRFCWPGEAKCYCDRDNDCYALEGYVACAPVPWDGGVPDAGGVKDAGRLDAGVVDAGRRDAGVTDFAVRVLALGRDREARVESRRRTRELLSSLCPEI